MTSQHEFSKDIEGPGAPASDPGLSFRAGFVALAGKPNAGKSTLMNALVGDKLAIVTPKAQTTRDRILGILTTDAFQAVFVDMPGLIDPADDFNAALMEIAGQALDGVDLVLHLIDVRDKQPAPEAIVARMQAIKVPVALVWTHCDLLKDHEQPPALPAELDKIYRARFAVSSTLGFGLGEIVAALPGYLPTNPPLYDPEQLTDRNMRFAAAELVREQVMLLLGMEVPYSVACVTEEFKEREDGRPDYVRVSIFVERDSQKPIVVGVGGAMLKKIGAAARAGLEEATGRRVFLDLWVKVKKNWRKNPNDRKRFGYGSERKKKGK